MKRFGAPRRRYGSSTRVSTGFHQIVSVNIRPRVMSMYLDGVKWKSNESRNTLSPWTLSCVSATRAFGPTIIGIFSLSSSPNRSSATHRTGFTSWTCGRWLQTTILNGACSSAYDSTRLPGHPVAPGPVHPTPLLPSDCVRWRSVGPAISLPGTERVRP